jgi:hypothetical protein
VTAYQEFIEAKLHHGADSGFEPLYLPDCMFDFQQTLTAWALRKGRGAIYADCGLGKTLMQLVWADNVVRKMNRPVLLLTPIAVGHQTLAEAQKFGIQAERSRDGKVSGPTVVISNYERLHYFDRNEFAAVVCDESSILKNFDGSTRKAITEFMRAVPYRLLCTATAAPNDFIELGSSSEALGYLGHTDMLTRFFKSDSDSIRPFAFGLRNQYEGGRWRIKGHAEVPFWRWVCSWARALRKPSDVGGSDDGFELPPLLESEQLVEMAEPAPGMLFTLPAVGLDEQRAERRRTIKPRCERVAAITEGSDSALVWCHLNVEGDLLAKLIPGAIQVSGRDSDEAKEEAFLAFTSGQARVLVTKPSVGAWGLNFQHCAHITFFPSHSFEQHYQGIRRCWRFGQRRPVRADIVTSEGERGVLDNLRRKAKLAGQMFDRLVELMHQGQAVSADRNATNETRVPSWLSPPST